MTLADLLWFVFSTGGLVVVLVVLGAWLVMASRSRARALAAALVVGYAAATIYPIPHAVGRLLKTDFEPFARANVQPGPTAIVLLGSGSFTTFDWSNNRHGMPDPAGLARTLEAARVFRLVDAVRVISSSGPAETGRGDHSAADLMKAMLVQLGVPAGRVVVSTSAHDTRTEALTIARLLPSLHVEHVVLVTSHVHMRRAVGAFRAAGVQVIPAPARDQDGEMQSWRIRLLPSNAGLRESADVAHELAGLVYYRLKGWQ
jgi:uncharacterized SAM-binding protein YcdF (DUF218 family)